MAFHMISYSIYIFYHTQNNHCVRKAFPDQSGLHCGGYFRKGIASFYFPSFANIASALSFCKKKEAEKKQIDRALLFLEKKCIDICECLSLCATVPLFHAELSATFLITKRKRPVLPSLFFINPGSFDHEVAQ